MPYRPLATDAAMAMYGFMSAAAKRYSTRVDCGEPGMTRSAVVRFSTPQVAIVGDQAPRTIRSYEMLIGAISAVKTGISATCPATKCCIALLIACGAPGS